MSDFDQNAQANAKVWDLPTVGSDNVDTSKTNALNQPLNWKFEPPEEEEQDIRPLTAEEIEAIRQSAYEEGHTLGREEGFAQGFEAGKDEGFKQGQEEGLAAGHEQGFEQGKADVDAQISQLSGILDKLQHPLASLDKAIEQELLILCTKLAAAVIKVEVTSNKDIILNAISEGIKTLPIQDKRYQLFMHPADIDLVQEHMGIEAIQNKNWQLVEAPNMQRGGCDVLSENNAVDVSIEKRCRDIFTRFLANQGIVDDPRAAE